MHGANEVSADGLVVGPEPSKLMARVQIPVGASGPRRFPAVFCFLLGESKNMGQAHNVGARSETRRFPVVLERVILMRGIGATEPAISVTERRCR